jgi:cellulose synthase/poly-beta-1,6-N-acetylglucosamine synthase-like glycosyltransferase
MPYFVIAWLVLFAAYLLVLLYARYKWHHYPRPITGAEPTRLLLSVIIPVRNEEHTIIPLLQDLLRQDYPSHLYDIIVVDDHSTDRTLEILREFLKGVYSNIRILEAKNSTVILPSPKKNALAYGISVANGQCIVTTDGDCRVGPHWLKTHARYLSVAGVKMAAGPVFLHQEKSWLQKAQGLELAALIGAGAVSLQSGKPGMANGANLSFWSDAFEKVGGYGGNDHVISGDDEFLLRKIHGQFPDGVVFMKEKEAIVTTAPCEDTMELFQQRKRWAGKWKLHKDIFSLFLPFFIFLFYLGHIAIFGLLFIHFRFIWLILSTFILKTAAEFLFLRTIRSFAEKNVSFPVLILLQIVYPFYAVFFGIMANAGGFTWKGRTYSAHAYDRRRV